MCDARIRCRSGRFSIDDDDDDDASRQRPTRRAACDARATRVDATRSPRRFDARRRARRRDATTTTTTTREFVGDSDDARFFEDVGARDGVGVGVGRVDVVGGIADYSGATVAQLALRRTANGVSRAVRRRGERDERDVSSADGDDRRGRRGGGRGAMF